MVRNLIILRACIYGLLISGTMCFGSDHEQGTTDSSVSSQPNAILQTFYRKEGEAIVVAARFIDLSNRRKILHTIHKLDDYEKKISPKKLREEIGGWYSQGGGIYRTKKLPLSSRYLEISNLPQNYLCAQIEHTGLLEPMLDLPQCSISLQGDGVLIEIRDTQQEFLINPEKVEKIKNKCVALNKFVIIIKSSGKKTSYIITQYKNNSRVHWNGWMPCWVGHSGGMPLLLNGFEEPTKADSIEEITIDLDEDKKYYAAHATNKQIGRAIRFLSLISVLVGTCYIFRDKLELFLKK